MEAASRPSERGAALLTVLMIIAAMAVAALAVASTVTQSTQRARALDAQAQLGFYAVAAEEVAKARLTGILEPLQSRLSADMPGFAEPQLFPVDDGVLSVTVRDATNCFDVNTLTQSSDTGEGTANSTIQNDFQILLKALIQDGFASDTAALISSLTDWMDANSVPGNGGAEDSYYLSEVPSYRTSGQPLTTIDELRAIRGYTPQIVATLRPVLCALPVAAQREPWALNINTLEERHAPLLQMVFGEALSLDDARSLILTRPQGGWSEVESFLEDPLVERIDPDSIQTDRLGVITTLVEVSANVSYRGNDMTMRYLFEAVPGRAVQTLSRERVG